MKRAKKIASTKKPKALPTAQPLIHWIKRMEQLIAKHSTPARTRGKYKGHGSTDSVAVIYELMKEIQADIRKTNRGIGYDENMALGSRLGAALFAWYTLLHKAKINDPNRPLETRQRAEIQREQKIAELFTTVNRDDLMVAVWANQRYNIPHGIWAQNGTFV